MMPQEMPQQELPEGATEYPFLRNMQLVPRLPINELNVVRQQQELQRMQQQELQQQLQQQLQQVRNVLDCILGLEESHQLFV